MRVVLADTYGMCFGVRDALALASSASAPRELTVLGELVHNPEVLRRLRERGVRSVPSADAPVSTPRVMVTAHGLASSRLQALRERGLEVLDATCPLVTHAHRRLAKLVAEGCFPVVIGQARHVEVRGMVEDLDEYLVIESEEDLAMLPHRPALGVVSQTTQPLDRVLELVAKIRAARPFSEVRFADTVCQPTKARQEAARRLARSVPVVIVVGGRGSNNSRQLVRACEEEGARAYLIESADEVRAEWLAGCEAVGLTAGTSTPDTTVAEVQRALAAISNVNRIAPPVMERAEAA